MEDKSQSGPFREIRRVIVGLIVAFGIVALTGSAVFYFFPTFLSSQGPEWTARKNKSVSIYYQKGDLSEVNPDSLLVDVTRSEQEIVNKLGIEESKVPDRIRVYLHEDLGALRSAVAARKTSSGAEVPLAVMDVIAGYDFKPVLVRLLTLFSWGQPSSEFLRLGLQLVLSDQANRPHLRVQALEDRSFSLGEMLALEQVKGIPRTLHDKIYDSFDSPDASAGMSLAQFSNLIRFEESTSPFEYELKVESSSFVSYVIENYGPAVLRPMWKADTLGDGVKKAVGLSLGQFENDWLIFVNNQAEDDPIRNYYKALGLFSRGKLDKSKSLLDTIPEEKIQPQKRLFLTGKIAFYRGNWEGAGTYFSRLTDQYTTSGAREASLNAYRELLGYYRSGEERGSGKVVLFTPADSAKISDLTEVASNTLEKAKRNLPLLLEDYGSLRLFIYNGTDMSTAWRRIDLPEWVSISSGVENLSLRISESVVGRFSRTPTYSNLLRRGLIHYLANQNVFGSAKQVLTGGNWEPLNDITIGLDPESNSSTEAAAFVGYLLSRYGADKFNRIWGSTTPLGGDNSLEASLNRYGDKGLSQLENDLKDFLRSYEP